MGYYANGYGYFEVKEEKDIVARFDEAMKNVSLTGDLKVFLYTDVPDHSVIEFIYYDQKYWEDEMMEVLNALTPLVVEGSGMEFRGEDNSLWAFFLEDGKWVEHEGYVMYK